MKTNIVKIGDLEFKLPFKYDGVSYIFDADGNMVGKARGFGRAQYDKSGFAGYEAAAKRVDCVGETIALALNEYFKYKQE